MTRSTTWGTPISGEKQKISEQTGLNVGDKVILGAKYECRIDVLHGYNPLAPRSEKDMLEEVMEKTKEQFWNDFHFDLEYVKVSVTKYWQTPLSQAFKVDVLAHCVVQLASPLSGIEIVAIIGAVATLIGVLIKVAIVYVCWRVIEPFVSNDDKVLGIPIAPVVLIILILIGMWIFFRRK